MIESELVFNILDGNMDDSLEAITNAIYERRQSLRNRKILLLKRNDKVRFNNSVRPKYLQGLVGEIQKVNRTTVTVKIIEEDKIKARRYGYGSFRTPVSLVEKVEV